MVQQNNGHEYIQSRVRGRELIIAGAIDAVFLVLAVPGFPDSSGAATRAGPA